MARRGGEALAEEEGVQVQRRGEKAAQAESKQKQSRRQQRTAAPGNTLVKSPRGKKAFVEAFRGITGREPLQESCDQGFACLATFCF